MSRDDKLKKATEEIKKILKKYDIAGTLTLVSKTHAEYLYHFPGWSVLQWNAQGDGIDIKSKKKDYADQAEQKTILEQSTHIVMQNLDIAGQSFIMFETIYKSLKKYMKIEHKPFQGFEPHRPDG